MTKKKETSVPTKFGNGWNIKLYGKNGKNPRIAFGCGAVQISEKTLDATITYLESNQKIKGVITKLDNSIDEKQKQINSLNNEISKLEDKKNLILNKIKVPKEIRSLNSRIKANNYYNPTVEDQLIKNNATLTHVKALKRLFNNKTNNE